MFDWLKRLVAGRELRALNRYRYACHLVHRWNAMYPTSSDSADWIQQVGEGARPADIEQFRDRIAAQWPVLDSTTESASGWVLYGADDEHTPWACHCPDRASLLREVADAVFASTEDLDESELRQCAEIADALIEHGRFDFEGDPTMYLRAAGLTTESRR